MNRRTLARHRLTESHRFGRTSAEGGGGGTGTGTGTGTSSGTSSGTGTGTADTGGAGTGSTGTGTGTGSGTTGDKGFPEGTALEQMTVEQREAYWKHYARQHEARANSRSDYDAVKAKADQFDELQRQQMTPSQQAIEAAKAEGRAEASRAANEDQVQNLLRVALAARGKSGDDLNELVAAANPAAFIAEGKVVADKVTTYAAKIAGAGTPGGGGGGGNGLGQGRREGQGKPSVATGRELFENRRGRKDKATTST